MKSITMSEESYKGIPADAEAFTLEDEKRWFESQDISCMPAVLATLKGLRATVAVTAVAVVDAAGETVAAGRELSVSAGESLLVYVERTPVFSGYPCTWASADATKVKVTKVDDSSALIEPVVANSTAITVTVTASSGVTSSVTVKPVA